MYDRTLEATLKQVSRSFPVVLITGPRQVGKTTLLEMCSDGKRGYVSLDNLEARYLAQNDPELFMETYPAPMIIDEIQYAPQLFTYVKIVVDQQKKKGMYWFTGSQKFELMKGITESLAGRVAILDLLGLSLAELNNQAQKVVPFVPTKGWMNKTRKAEKVEMTMDQVYRRIWQGSFPEVIRVNAKNREIFYRSYLQTYIQRDVRDILNITDSLAFLNFITILAARTGQQLNYSAVSKAVGVDSKTVKSWVSVLQTSGLIYLLQPYSSNVGKRITKSPKVYFLDTGLCAYLTGWSDHKALESGVMSGAFLETFVLSEIIKSYWHNGITPNIYYYRDNDQRELDLLIEENQTLYPIEFKKTVTPSLHAAKAFQSIKILDKAIGAGAIVCFVSKITPLSSQVMAVPISCL